MPLPSLPIDILLVILRDLEIVDVLRAGMICKDLYQTIQDRHVWVDQLENSCQKDPALRSAIPPLTSLSTQELKTFVTRRAKLRLRWGKDDGENGLVTKGLVGIFGIRMLWLLPGGRSVLVIDNRRGLTLRRVELDDGRASLPIVANIEYDQEAIAGPEWFTLLTVMSPCPILIYSQRDTMHFIRIDHHNNVMNPLEATSLIPVGYSFLQAHGQGRVVGLLMRGTPGPLRAVVIHLDYPGFTLEYEVPPAYIVDSGVAFPQWSICIPTESLAIIYSTQHILAYEIPNFSTLSHNTNLSCGIPTWNWPGADHVDESVRYYISHMTGEALHDPSFAHEFNLHFICEEHPTQMGPVVTTVTIPINTDRNAAPNPTEKPELKYTSTDLQEHVGELFGFSCQKGLHLDRGLEDEKFRILVTPLDDLVSEGGRGTLRVLLSDDPLEFDLRRCGVDMDDASGRVIIWEWDKGEYKYESKIFIGDLV